MTRKKAKRRAKYRFAKQPPAPSRETTLTSPLSSRAVTITSTEVGLPATQKDRYRYLLADLRQIGIIAASLFLILIVLSFIVG